MARYRPVFTALSGAAALLGAAVPAQAENRATAAPVLPHHPAHRAARKLQASPSATGGQTVCGLGRTFGHWAATSDAAQICRQVYG
jgi:uncharacterized low-complexity protein